MFEYYYHEILRRTIISFGTLFNGIEIKHDDSDGDGSDNLTEYIAGTDPIDASSVFFVSGFDLRSSERIVSWDSVAGRSYQVLLSTDLAFDSFLPISSSLSYPINVKPCCV